jgi:hypothetical protein
MSNRRQRDELAARQLDRVARELKQLNPGAPECLGHFSAFACFRTNCPHYKEVRRDDIALLHARAFEK